MSDPREVPIDVLALPSVKRFLALDATLARVGPRRASFSRMALVALNAAVMSLNAWEMHMRHSPHHAEDWGFDLVAVGFTVAAACFLPNLLREAILVLYSLVLVLHLVSEPIFYLQTLLGPHGADTDIFFGSLIWAIQSLLLLGYGAGCLLRRIEAKLASRAA